MATAVTQPSTNLVAPHLLADQFEQLKQDQIHDVKTTLNYYKDPGDGSAPPPSIAGKPETFERPTEPLATTIHDIRGQESKYSLDGHGFLLYHHKSVEKDFPDDDQIKRVYYPETEQLLKDATGASRVFIFDHTVRRPTADRSGDPNAPASALSGPVNRVHVDQSYSAARSRVPHHLGAELGAVLLSSRYQIINVWRPIKTIYKSPLAIAEAHSVPESDLVPVSLIYPDRRGEILTVRPNTAHKWYYAYGQTPEEVLFIKCYDSKTDGRARRVPHTAFVNPATEGEEFAPRESIEVRALVFHEDDKE